MPTYAYLCKACGHTFDAVQSFTDDALTECPECGGTLRKQYGSVGVSFKGSGFYRTDSRGGSGGVAPASTSGDGAGSAPTAAPAKTESTGGGSAAGSSSSGSPAASSPKA